MTQPTDRRPMLYSRVEPDDLQRAQELADRLYDGNLSLLVRNAVKQFIARQGEAKGQEAA